MAQGHRLQCARCDRHQARCDNTEGLKKRKSIVSYRKHAHSFDNACPVTSTTTNPDAPRPSGNTARRWHAGTVCNAGAPTCGRLPTPHPPRAPPTTRTWLRPRQNEPPASGSRRHGQPRQPRAETQNPEPREQQTQRQECNGPAKQHVRIKWRLHALHQCTAALLCGCCAICSCAHTPLPWPRPLRAQHCRTHMHHGTHGPKAHSTNSPPLRHCCAPLAPHVPFEINPRRLRQCRTQSKNLQ